MSLGDKVLTARKSKGLTQEQLAERASLTVRTVQGIENGDAIPRDYTLKAIASALHMPLEEFISTCSCLHKHVDKNIPKQEVHPAVIRQDCHFLQLLNLSAFTYLVVPFAHFLIPILLLRKKKEIDSFLQSAGRRIIRQQIYWTITTTLLLVATVLYNFNQTAGFTRNLLLTCAWIFAGMYLLNAVIIGFTAIRLRNNERAAYINIKSAS